MSVHVPVLPVAFADGCHFAAVRHRPQPSHVGGGPVLNLADACTAGRPRRSSRHAQPPLLGRLAIAGHTETFITSPVEAEQIAVRTQGLLRMLERGKLGDNSHPLVQTSPGRFDYLVIALAIWSEGDPRAVRRLIERQADTHALQLETGRLNLFPVTTQQGAVHSPSAAQMVLADVLAGQSTSRPASDDPGGLNQNFKDSQDREALLGVLARWYGIDGHTVLELLEPAVRASRLYRPDPSLAPRPGIAAPPAVAQRVAGGDFPVPWVAGASCSRSALTRPSPDSGRGRPAIPTGRSTR
jgi:hypothetical protein